MSLCDRKKINAKVEEETLVGDCDGSPNLDFSPKEQDRKISRGIMPKTHFDWPNLLVDKNEEHRIA